VRFPLVGLLVVVDDIHIGPNLLLFYLSAIM